MLPSPSYHLPGTPKALRRPSLNRRSEGDSGGFLEFAQTIRNKYPFLTQSQIRNRARKEWAAKVQRIDQRQEELSSESSSPPCAKTTTDSTRNFSPIPKNICQEVISDTLNNSPHDLCTVSRITQRKTYSGYTRTSARSAVPEIVHDVSSTHAGILKSRSTNETNSTKPKHRVSFGIEDEQIFFSRPTGTSSATCSVKSSPAEPDIYEFSSENSISDSFDSDEDRAQLLNCLHHNFTQKKTEQQANRDKEWENVMKTQNKATLQKSPSTKVIEWMNSNLDARNYEEPSPDSPSSDLFVVHITPSTQKSQSQSNNKKDNELKKIEAQHQRPRKAPLQTLPSIQNMTAQHISDKNTTTPKRQRGRPRKNPIQKLPSPRKTRALRSNRKENVQTPEPKKEIRKKQKNANKTPKKLSERERLLLEVLKDTSFFASPKNSQQLSQSQNSSICNELDELFPEAPMNQSMRCSFSARFETKSNFHSMYDEDEDIFFSP